MRIGAIIVVVVGILLAGITLYLGKKYLDEAAELGAEVEIQLAPTVQIIVAAQDLAAGMVLETVATMLEPQAHLKWQTWAEEALVEGYIVQQEDDGASIAEEKASALFGTIVRFPITTGEPVTLKKVFKRGEAGFLSGMLNPGMRAVSIRIDEVSGTAGFIMPGDRVDVIMTLRLGGAADVAIEKASNTILENVRVLAVDQSVGDVEGIAKVSKTATIEVTPKRAELLAAAASIGNLSLSLRSLAQPSAAKQEAGGEPTPKGAAAPVKTNGSPIPGVRVLGAVQELPAGTLLRGGDMRWVDLPMGFDPANHFIEGFLEGQDTRALLRGALVAATIAEGQPLALDGVIRPDDPGFLAAAVTPGMRAVTIAGIGALDPGVVAPGNRVDVVLTSVVDGRRFSETVLQNVRILASSPDGKATVELSPKRAEMLTVAKTMGQLTLFLRSPDAPPDIYEGPFTSDLEVSRAISGGISEDTGWGGAGEQAAAAPAMPAMAAMPAAPAAPVGTRVIVAERELTVGTLITDSDLRFQFVKGLAPSEEYFIQGAVGIESLRGALITRAVVENGILGVNMLIKPSQPGFLARALGPGMRAVSIATDPVSAVSGFVSPGDRVDVLMTHELDDLEEDPLLTPRRFTETIAEYVRVIAIEQTIDESSGKPVVGNTATVEVTPKQAETLALGISIGKLSLALHSATPATEMVETEPFTSDVEISDATTNFLYRTEPIYDASFRPESLVSAEEKAAKAAEKEAKKVADAAEKERRATELKFWEAIVGSDDPADYSAYLESYPDGQFASLARARAGKEAVIAAEEKAAKAAAETAEKERRANDLKFWAAIEGSADAADYNAYLEAYPDGQFASLARARAEKGAVAAVETAPAGPKPIGTGGTEKPKRAVTVYRAFNAQTVDF